MQSTASRKRSNPSSVPNTLNFSELNEDEKAKYLEFILASNINFQEDKDGSMVVAKVKIRGKNIGQRIPSNNKENQCIQPKYRSKATSERINKLTH